MADDRILEFAAVQADADFVANVKLALSLLWARRECTAVIQHTDGLKLQVDVTSFRGAGSRGFCRLP